MYKTNFIPTIWASGSVFVFSSFVCKICLYAPPFPLDLHQNGLSLGHALLGLSPSAPPGPKEGDLATHDTGLETKRASTEKG